MRDIQKTLTQEQKETVYEFVAGWIKSGRKLNECMFENMRSIIDGDVTYTITMSNFDKDKLFKVSANPSLIPLNPLDISPNIFAIEFRLSKSF